MLCLGFLPTIAHCHWHLSFDSYLNATAFLPHFNPAFWTPAVLAASTYAVTSSSRDNILRVGLNYQFGSTPVVTK
jgi:hypothetical protein